MLSEKVINFLTVPMHMTHNSHIDSSYMGYTNINVHIILI